MGNNIIQKQATSMQNGEKKTLQQYIKSMEGEIKKALPSVITPERFTRMVLSAISTNPKSDLRGAYLSTRFSTVFFAISSKFVFQGENEVL